MTQEEFKQKLSANYNLIPFKDGFIITGLPLITLINWNQYEIKETDHFIEIRHPQTKSEITIFKDKIAIQIWFR